jgi:aminoglycoside 2''-phosphotransferase
VARHFETHLADAATFAYTPALIHGDFGASNILYDAKARAISGIIDWSSAGLGDPAVDLAALICPASYGEEFAARLAGVYPGVAELLPRARFYIGTFALQEALFGVEQGDDEALRRGLEEYV